VYIVFQVFSRGSFSFLVLSFVHSHRGIEDFNFYQKKLQEIKILNAPMALRILISIKKSYKFSHLKFDLPKPLPSNSKYLTFNPTDLFGMFHIKAWSIRSRYLGLNG